MKRNLEMSEEEKALNGQPYFPNEPELNILRLNTHRQCIRYNALDENDIVRNKILCSLLDGFGDNSKILGPIYFRYGKHTRIGKNVFIDTNFTLQDDSTVIIGDNCIIGPNVTIITTSYPLNAYERSAKLEEDGVERFYCTAKPVVIENNCLIGANVTILPGVSIGANSVIGAGSVVNKDIPVNCLADGNPCKVRKKI